MNTDITLHAEGSSVQEEDMMKLMRGTAILAIVGMPLLLAGCASNDDLKKAQDTADQALTAAHGAQQSAQGAQSAAEAAQQTAAQNGQKIDALSQQVQQMQQNQQTPRKSKHRGERG